ncbi:MAG: ABC transporter ATP-binding protein [Burkholderiaceae bacterium]|nr:ABC transporter ATP-binding protein [Burkholderiaceae bacterium]
MHIGLAYESKAGRNQVLKDITLRVEPGEFFALLGPSGSGKSTLLRLIAGFNQHNQGRLLVDGQDISGVPPHARNIGMVFQNYALWPHLTVYDNVAFGLVERRLPRVEIKRRVEEALALVDLADYAQRRPHQLSGGQQQRVALARTIVIEPQVLLLDEPLSNLDKKLREQMRQELLRLQRQLGITTIFVTHDQEEAMTTADRMAVLEGGVLQQVGTPAELFDHPANAFVAGFVGTANLLHGEVEARNGRLVFKAEGVGELVLPPSPNAPKPGRTTLSFRPHTTVLEPRASDAADDGRTIWLEGEIVSAEFLGEFTRYRVRAGSAELTADQPHLAGQPTLAAGSAVRMGVDAAQIRYLGR